MLDPNYNLTVILRTMDSRQARLKLEMETRWRLKPLTLEPLRLGQRLQAHFERLFVTFGLKPAGRFANDNR
jgi:hypothetical protein